jgi:hypothetical protein
MKKTIFKSLLLIPWIILLSCGNNNKNLDSIVEKSPLSLIEFKGMDPSTIGHSRSVNVEVVHNAIKIHIDPSDPNPDITLELQEETSNLTGYLFVSFDVKNTSNEEILVTCRLNGEPWIEGADIIPAGGKGTVKTFIPQTNGIAEYLREAFFGMNGIPGNLTSIPVPGYDVHDIHTLLIKFPNTSLEHTLRITNIRAEPGIKYYTSEELADDFFPFVDEFGQFSHSEWEEKIYSMEELRNSNSVEDNDLQIYPGPEDWNKYGGWADGPQLEATGNFRTEKYMGKWWLIDPEGKLFWSHGIDEISANNTTPVTGREHYFTTLPSRDEYPDSYSDRNTAPFGYYNGKRATLFNISMYNLMRKYGESWQDKYIDRTHRRLRSWGMNTMGAWTSETMYLKQCTPYTVVLHSRGRTIEGSEGYWSRFPDPFDEDWRKNISDRMMLEKGKSATDTFCIGYFIDNELTWGNNRFLAISALKSPADQPVKLAFRDFLQKKYKSIAGLNSKWKTNFKSWNEFLASNEVPDNIDNDLVEFNIFVARQYLSTCRNELNKAAPGKLYLGARWDFHMYPLEDTTSNWLLRIVGDYCDVISFNRYRYTCLELVPPDGVDKPVMISEWHIGTLDRGMFHFGLRFAKSLEQENLLYKNYLSQALKNEYIVGTHWFRYSDQALTGRLDGENFRIGFIDICDQPYNELVGASREIGYNMYRIRTK